MLLAKPKDRAKSLQWTWPHVSHFWMNWVVRTHLLFIFAEIFIVARFLNAWNFICRNELLLHWLSQTRLVSYLLLNFSSIFYDQGFPICHFNAIQCRVKILSLNFNAFVMIIYTWNKYFVSWNLYKNDNNTLTSRSAIVHFANKLRLFLISSDSIFWKICNKCNNFDSTVNFTSVNYIRGNVPCTVRSKGWVHDFHLIISFSQFFEELASNACWLRDWLKKSEREWGSGTQVKIIQTLIRNDEKLEI